MTRKHFEALSAALVAAKERCAALEARWSEIAVHEAHEVYAEEIARVCKAFNPIFDRDKFMCAAEAE